MTLVDLIKLGLIRTDAQAEHFAESIVNSWHDGMIPGELRDVLGLTPREYQAWTTGGVSLLTIAQWQRTSHPPLDPSRPWFRLSGRPGREIIGYLEDQARTRRSRRGRISGRRKTELSPSARTRS
jgi:hypothetical protein